MVNIKVSTSWQKGKEYKQPFYYAIGVGLVSDEDAETYDDDEHQLVFLHRLDMGDLLKLGIANEMDFMSKALMDGEDGEKKPEDAKEAVANVVKRAQNFENMERMINLVCTGGLIEPKVYETPEHANARQKGLMYVDEIPWDDRMELFSVIFESEGLSTFREEQDPGVGNVANVSDVPLPPDGPVDIRPDDSEGVLLQSGSVPLREEVRASDERSGSDIEEKQEARTGS